MKQILTSLQKTERKMHFHVRFFLSLFFVFQFITLSNVNAQSDGLPRGAYDLPYTRYESENATKGGGATLKTSTDYSQTNPASEASDQKYVALPSNGSSVTWTMSNSGAGVTLRFTMPDASGGGAGLTGKLNFYVNNTIAKTIDLSSYWSYQYFNLYEHDPTNFPAALTFMRFDEVHFKLASKLNVGDIVKIQKDNGDALEYGVDFIEVEEIPAAIAKPAGYLSVTDYGAVANDGIDDQAAFDKAIVAADAANTGIYIPEGTFTIAKCWRVGATNIGIKGAGMWYSNIYYSTNEYFSGGMMGTGSDLDISDLYISTANNLRWVNGVYRVYKGFMGTYGANTKMQRLWIEHFECGMWIGGYDETPIVNTTNLLISHCRIRNNYADGINLCQGTNNSVIEFCNVRNEGDDGLASWPAKDMTNSVNCSNLIFRNNTIENNWRAGSIGFFGGKNHQVHHNLVKDGVAGSGIRFTTEFSGFLFEENTEMKIYENTFISCGTSTDLVDQQKGAIELYAAQGPITNLTFTNNTIINAQRDAVVIGGNAIDNVVFNNLIINGTGLNGQTKSTFSAAYPGGHAIFCFAGSGTTTFNNLAISNINGQSATPYYKGNSAYNLIINPVATVPVSSVSLLPVSASLNVGATQQLTPTVLPANATNKSVTYSSNNQSVATVSATGLVKGISAGTATITVTTLDQTKTATCAVTVGCDVPVTGVTLSPATLSLQAGASSQLTSTVSPSNACTLSVQYISSNQSVATVSTSGLVTAVSIGTSTITVKTDNGSKTATCEVTVSCNVPVTGVTLPASLALEIGANSTLSANVAPSNACLKTVSWISSKNSVATVSETGLVKAIASGTATITATTQDGSFKASTSVSVAAVVNPPCTGSNIVHTNSDLSIDGTVDAAWANAPEVTIANATIGTLPSDYAGKYKVLWNSTYLYFFVDVNDASKLNDSGTSWWEDDVIELFIDGDNSKGSSYDGVNDFQLGFRWNDATINLGGSSVTRTTGIVKSMAATANGYALEVAIPWTTIGVTPTIGNKLGIEVEVDDDNGGTRDTQSGAFSTTTTAWSTPSVFGTGFFTSCDLINASINVSDGSNNKVSVWPNPVNDILNINLNGNLYKSVSILDLSGRLVQSKSINNNESAITIDFASLRNGMYMVHLISEKDSEVLKIVKK